MTHQPPIDRDQFPTPTPPEDRETNAINVSGRRLGDRQAKDIQAQSDLINQVLKHNMQSGVHYGIIPGTQKPSLFKPGAEKIASLFRLVIRPEMTETITDDLIRYKCECSIYAQSGDLLGVGIGVCSSGEEKYKWRRAFNDDEFAEEDPARRRIKHGRWKDHNTGNFKHTRTQQVRTDPFDLENTIMKMAKKRAMCDGILTVTAASDIFEHDNEADPTQQTNNQAEPKAETIGSKAADEAKNLAREKKGKGRGKTITAKQIEMIDSKAKRAGVSDAALVTAANLPAGSNWRTAPMECANQMLKMIDGLGK